MVEFGQRIWDEVWCYWEQIGNKWELGKQTGSVMGNHDNLVGTQKSKTRYVARSETRDGIVKKYFWKQGQDIYVKEFTFKNK
jgi:hypothetical protein